MKLLIVIALAFVVVDIIIVSYVLYRRYRKKMPSAAVKKIQDTWKAIIRQSDRRHAVMDADKLLDYALTSMGIKGNLGAKLKQSNHLFSDINKVWAAHKVRNNIAHQINYSVTEKVYKNTMLSFKQAFKDLKIF